MQTRTTAVAVSMAAMSTGRLTNVKLGELRARFNSVETATPSYAKDAKHTTLLDDSFSFVNTSTTPVFIAANPDVSFGLSDYQRLLQASASIEATVNDGSLSSHIKLSEVGDERRFYPSMSKAAFLPPWISTTRCQSRGGTDSTSNAVSFERLCKDFAFWRQLPIDCNRHCT
jgi:hypothetical protein